MKFSEKLQILRKENKLSQEQLADMLDVSRQSVSKWESGQTYPEMDKLISMCKIFKCSLDELTNDEIKEVNSSTKTKNNFSNLIDELLEIINRSFSIFKNMKSKDIISIIFEMCILFVLLAIMEKPFNYIDNLGYNVFVNFGSVIGDILSSIFHFIIMASYVILSIVIFVYIYKIRVLDRYEAKLSEDKDITEKEEPVREKEEIKSEKKQETVIKKEVKDHDYHIFNVLGNIIMAFIKFICFWMSIPFIFSLLGLSMAFIIMILLMFTGVLYFGIFLAILFSIALNILVVELIFDFMFNKKVAIKRIFITFIISLVGLGMACGLITYEISDTTYVNSIPNVKESIEYKEYDMTKDLTFVSYDDEIEYVVDNTMDNIKVEAKYNNGYAEPIFDSYAENSISLYTKSLENVSVDNLINIIIKDLRNKKVHNYWELYDVNYTIYGSEKNINTLKSNIDLYYENNQEDEYDYYENEIDNYQNTVDQFQEDIDKLKEDNEELKVELEEYKQKIIEYKDSIRTLLEE